MLRDLSEVEQDEVMARLLPRLWRVPSTSEPFRTLVDLTMRWATKAYGARRRWPDAALVKDALHFLRNYLTPLPQMYY